MTIIYLVRHGRTHWNAEGRFQGQGNSPLTAEGRAQAAHVGGLLASALADHAGPVPAQVSPLGRTVETAAIIADKLALSMTEEPRLKEIAFGEWEGRTRGDILASIGYTEGSKPVDWQFHAPGGERFDEIYARAEDWLRSLDMPVVVAISHGMIGRLIRGVYAGLAKDDMLTLPVPQDGYYRLQDGQIDFVG
ncbi:histidine phosphatase family protein [Oryzibacter oryziterrae]|uniref:histidine phosphatase family protein n=1 Tax=Oryzibacter oryziterrae TaxID=2766474 RepID=UPI001F2D091F|nr:histidine phosphatase family protein [Oryzibacter oryziterrae]